MTARRRRECSADAARTATTSPQEMTVKRFFRERPRSELIFDSTLHVSSMAPRLADEEFSTQLEMTNGQAINMEGELYWDAFGVPFAGGVAIMGTRLP